MRTFILAFPIAGLLAVGTGATQAGLKYPLTVALDATYTAGASTINSKVTIQVTKPMTNAARARVTDALEHGGYSDFVNMLRPVPSVGSIESRTGSVPVRYTREEQDGPTTRLVLIADSPLFFLSSDPSRNRTGFDLTVVELLFDGKGGIAGKMAGAARVRPRPTGPLLDDYADALVELKGRMP